MIFFKSKNEEKETIFDIPVIEARAKFQEMSSLIYEIVGSDSFAELSTKTIIPNGSTKSDVEKLLKENAPKKIKQVLDVLLLENFERIIKLSSIIFCEDYDEYMQKSINEICDDYLSLSKASAKKLIDFFTRAGR